MDIKDSNREHDYRSLPKIVSLDGEWEYCYRQSIDCMDDPSIPKRGEFTVKMPVPGYWDDHIERLKDTDFWSYCIFNPEYKEIKFPMAEMGTDASLPYLVGVGYYRKEVFVENISDDQTTTLLIGGVSLEAWIWVNGQLAGYHLGHSTSFEVSLDKYIKAGEVNEIIIAVANIRRDRTGCIIRGYKGLSAGIYRSVSLKISGHTRIESLYVYPSNDNQELNWNIELHGVARDKKALLDWKVIDKRHNKILGSGTTVVEENTVHMETETFGMKTWSDNAPNLYQIELKLYEGDNILDNMTQSFGLRTLKAKGTKLELNGNPIFLRGATEHAYFPMTCTPPNDISIYRQNIAKLKEIGFNWLRFHTWVPSEEYMQAADELGMLIQVEAPVGFEEDEWIDILYTCRKHPSVVIYCGGNEELLDEEKIDYLEQMAELCKEYVPDSLFNPQEALRGIEYYWQKSDMGEDIVEEPFLHNPIRLDKIKQFSDVLGQYTWGLLSYNSDRGDWRKIDSRMAIYEKPCLSHENGIHGNYLNLDLEHRYEGTRIGTSLFSQFRKYLDDQGLLDKATLYYRNSCAIMSIARKHNLELTRKCSFTAGYDFLGAIDYHWHRSGYPCGIMNEFYELKPGESVEDVLKYNGESILLLDYEIESLNFNYGDIVRFPIMVSLYGIEPIETGVLHWHLADDSNHVYQRGDINVQDLELGETSVLGTIEFTVPYLECPSKLTLYTRLSSHRYEIVNSWDIWAFPNVEIGSKYGDESLSDNIKIVSTLDMETISFLEKGGRVILLGSGPFEGQPTALQPYVTGRANGDLATVIYDHPLMEQFPHDGYCSYQFYSMLRGGNGIVFNDLEIPFDPIIEIVSSFKKILKKSALFEMQVGDGGLLVCSLNLEVDNPAAIFMRHSIIEYVSSDSFNPRSKVDSDSLRAILNIEKGETRQISTDQAFDINAQLLK